MQAAYKKPWAVLKEDYSLFWILGFFFFSRQIVQQEEPTTKQTEEEKTKEKEQHSQNTQRGRERRVEVTHRNRDHRDEDIVGMLSPLPVEAVYLVTLCAAQFVLR